jgi:hypothetical protein
MLSSLNIGPFLKRLLMPALYKNKPGARSSKEKKAKTKNADTIKIPAINISIIPDFKRKFVI